MTPKQFRSWRKAMGLKQRDAAHLLGVKKRQIRDYEKDAPKKLKKRQIDGLAIPRTVELACYALSRGVSEFDGETAKNSFNGLGASEDIEMVKPRQTSAKPKTKPSK